MIPYGKQSINKDDIDAVIAVLKSDFITQGPVVPAFEKAFSHYVGSNDAIAVSNATAGLHLACLALGVSKGDYVWTSPNSFVASANCALYCGANVDFVDIDLSTYNISIEALEEKLIQAEKIGKLPSVVIPVHFAGRSCDMKRIFDLSQKYQFKIIEDASHAVGATYDDSRVGDNKYSDIAVFSFHPVKIITTGEGGMVTCKSLKISEKIRNLRSHGITRDPGKYDFSSDQEWYYEQQCLGYNYRMTDIQAALGLSQLKRLEDFLAKRNKLAKRYHELLDKYESVCLPQFSDQSISSWHLFVVLLNNRDIAYQSLRENKIYANLHYIPIYKQPYYRKLNVDFNSCPNMESYYLKCLSLPIYFDLEEKDLDLIVRLL